MKVEMYERAHKLATEIAELETIKEKALKHIRIVVDKDSIENTKLLDDLRNKILEEIDLKIERLGDWFSQL